MATQTVRILRIMRADDASQHLLVHITQANVKKPLNLKLVATEHEHVYHGDIKSTQIAALKSEHFTGSNDDLSNIILFTFLQVRPVESTTESLKGLETIASLHKESFIITIRKNIGGITQRIAAISLVQDDDREEIAPFDWVDTAVQISEQHVQELTTTRSTLETQQKEIDSLKTRLDEFVKLKKEHEDDMLQKFAALLNTKKRRIRELRQRLEHEDTGGDEDENMPDPPEDKQRAKPSTSRASKRKAPQAESDVEMEEPEDDKTPQQTDDEDDQLDDAPPTQSSRAMRSQTVKDSQNSTAPHAEAPSQSRPRRGSPSIAPSPSMPIPEDEETDDEL